MELIYQRTLDTYINIWPQSVSYIPEFSRSFPLLFATNISYPFHFSFKPPIATQFSRHILSNMLYQSFHVVAMFQNRTCDLFFFCRVDYELCIFIWN